MATDRTLELESFLATVQGVPSPDRRGGRRARRRLERDLHDGAQQRLIVSLMILRRAAGEAADTPASPLLYQGIEHLEQGLAELRELARGIHPSQLSEDGLARSRAPGR